MLHRSTNEWRPPQQQGTLPFALETYGQSVLGAPLLHLPARKQCHLLVLAGMHGEEPETTVLLSRALRLLTSIPDYCTIILCANPDGTALGTRGNARGVDLNRNWPGDHWTAQTVRCRLFLEAERITELSSGSEPASEPETQALLTLIQKLNPREILSIHSPLACIDAPHRTPLVDYLSTHMHLPWQTDVGYATPGSMGSWCNENTRSCTTLELPREAPEILAQRYTEILGNLLQNTAAILNIQED